MMPPVHVLQTSIFVISILSSPHVRRMLKWRAGLLATRRSNRDTTQWNWQSLMQPEEFEVQNCKVLDECRMVMHLDDARQQNPSFDAEHSIRARLKGCIHVDNQLYASLLRQCGDSKTLLQGKYVHAHILASGKERHTFLGNLIVEMYGKCGSVENARKAFDQIHQKNVFSWTIVIAAFAQNGHYKEALNFLQGMHLEGVRPDSVTYASIVGVCSALRSLTEGKAVNAAIAENGYLSDIVVGNNLISMYSKCGGIQEARGVFDKMRNKTVVSWNAMIAAYAQCGRCEDGLELYQQMVVEFVKPDRITFLTILGACSSMGALEVGKAVHASILEHGFQSDLVVANSLVSMYGKCGCLENARSLFDKIRERDVVSWNAIIAAYAHCGHGEQALQLYKEMGVKPDRITFAAVLDACSCLKALEQGRAIHRQLVASDYATDPAVENSLVVMYGECGSVADARRVFDKMRCRRNIASWNSMMAAYARQGHSKDSIQLYQQMSLEGVKPDKITFVNVLEACEQLSNLAQGREIHAHIVATLGLECDPLLSTGLLNMYSKCGSLEDATWVFESMCWRDVVSWTAIITAYAQEGHGREALRYFCIMDLEGCEPNEITFSSITRACSSIGVLAVGKMVHQFIAASGCESDVVVGTALVDMYNKCGSLEDAKKAFQELAWKNVVSWNTMIAASAKHGHGKEALQLYRLMILEGLPPDNITFTNILFSCSHLGEQDELWSFVRSIIGDHGMELTTDHHCCIIDVLGRSGRLKEAEEVVDNMEFEPGIVEFTTLLGACKIEGDVERGARIATQVVELNPQSSTPYVLLSNAYTTAITPRTQDV